MWYTYKQTYQKGHNSDRIQRLAVRTLSYSTDKGIPSKVECKI